MSVVAGLRIAATWHLITSSGKENCVLVTSVVFTYFKRLSNALKCLLSVKLIDMNMINNYVTGIVRSDCYV